MSDKLAILGYSGHGFVVAEAAIASGLTLSYYCDAVQSEINPFSLSFIGNENDETFIGWNKNYQYILGIGNNVVRHKVAIKILSKNNKLLNVIHPNSSLSALFKMGVGNFISRQVSINTLCVIGDFCILNTGCILEHECIIGHSVHLAPGAVLAGNVSVGDFTFIGANAVVKQGIKIGKNVTVGAGAVVLNDIPDNCTVVGNPGRLLR